MKHEELISTMKAREWEVAKGHLRALVALDGSVSAVGAVYPPRFEIVSKAVEEFIEEFEGEGLNE